MSNIRSGPPLWKRGARGDFQDAFIPPQPKADRPKLTSEHDQERTSALVPAAWQTASLHPVLSAKANWRGYCVDFYAPKAKLVVEVDGSQHLDEEYAQKDARRSVSLEQQGLRLLRFSNLQVLQELDAVMEAIFQALPDPEKKIPPSPPLSKGG